MNEPQGDLTYARVLQVTARAAPDEASPDLLALARDRAVDAAVFDEYPPFFWSGEISSNRWDAYDTRMSGSTLKNFAAEATAGVAYLRGHDTHADAIGQSLTGHFTGGQGNGVARVTADFYALTTPDAVPFIAKMRGGVVRDQSVGFYGGQWVCSICGRDMQQWWGPDACPHLLGMTYTPRDETGQQKGQAEVARATIEDAHLAEVSGVYDGATPGAMIAKARAMSAEGLLSERRRELVAVRYRLALAAPLRSWPGADTGARGTTAQTQEDGMPPEAEQGTEGQGGPPPAETRAGEPTTTAGGVARDDLAAVRAALSEAGVANSPLDVVGEVRGLLGEVARLRPLADVGRQYRADLVAEALGEGNRAMGNGFAQESYRAVLETAPLTTIKQMRDDWKRLGDSQFAGGRQTTEGAQPPTTDAKQPALPVAAHRA